jgi:hypothetical protein
VALPIIRHYINLFLFSIVGFVAWFNVCVSCSVEFSTVTLVDGQVVFHVLTNEEVQSLLVEAEAWLKQQEAESEA